MKPLKQLIVIFIDKIGLSMGLQIVPDCTETLQAVTGIIHFFVDGIDEALTRFYVSNLLQVPQLVVAEKRVVKLKKIWIDFEFCEDLADKGLDLRNA